MKNLPVFTEEHLTRLLRQATGIDDVKPGRRPPISATIMLDTAIGTKSTQRICLRTLAGRRKWRLTGGIALLRLVAGAQPVPIPRQPRSLNTRILDWS